MSIVKLEPDAPVAAETTLPEAIQEPNKSIFTALVPEAKIASLLKYVEGYPWTIDYYGQIVNKNNTLENFDPSTPDLTQPYYEIKKLILQVSSPLSSNYDPSTGITTISGSGIVPYSVIPNVGDVFIASVDSGEDAIFIINSVSRKTYRKDTLYEVSYNLYSYTSENPGFISSLQSRIQQTFYFNKDTDFFNRDLLIKPSVKEAIDRLKIYLRETQEYYFSTFAQKEAGTILIPGIVDKAYDPLLLNFISKIINISDFVGSPFFKHNYLNNRYIEQPSFFDLLLSRNKALVNTINKQYRFISTSYLPNRTRLGTIFHTGVSYVLFPKEPSLATDIDTITYKIDNSNIDLIEDVKTSKNYFLPSIDVQTTSNDSIYTKPLLHELFLDDYYVVSENFYNYITDNTTYSNISYIELLLYRHINKEAIAKEDLVVAIESYMNWSLLHQLYLLPVLWLLINNNL